MPWPTRRAQLELAREALQVHLRVEQARTLALLRRIHEENDAMGQTDRTSTSPSALERRLTKVEALLHELEHSVDALQDARSPDDSPKDAVHMAANEVPGEPMEPAAPPRARIFQRPDGSWGYFDQNYPEEGSVAPFDFIHHAVQHAQRAGYDAEYEIHEASTAMAHPLPRFPLSAEDVARVCHAANAELNRIYGEDTIEWQEGARESVIAGVEAAQKESCTAIESHNRWLRYKQAEGWKLGPVKDSIDKRHPLLVPWSQLPEHEKVKDRLFVAIVEAFTP